VIWLTWRQHRAQFIAGVVLCAVLVAFLVVTGLGMRSTYHSLGVDTCLAATPARDCTMLLSQFQNQYSSLQFLIPLFLLLPVLFGVFWGAPLIAREVEQGTFRLAWTQSVTRRRWTVTKLVIVGSVAVILSSAFSAVLWWWADPLVAGPPGKRFSFGIFDLLGVVPVAYTLFAVALGVAAGVVLRRTTLAMAATLGGFAAVRLAVELVLRPNFQSAVAANYPFSFSPKAGTPDGAWVLAENTVTASGVVVSGESNGISLSFAPLHQICSYLSPDTTPGSAAMQQCITRNGIHVVATFQPYDRYWLFQGIESALFIVLAIALVVFSVWWVRRRVR
jgi:ABC-type multidrug transport system permease subunit